MEQEFVTGASGAPPNKIGILTIGTLAIVTIGWIVSGVWLERQIGWPDHYGFACHGRGCLFQDMVHSPALLDDGQPLAILMFVHIWILPVIVIAIITVVRRGKALRNAQPAAAIEQE